MVNIILLILSLLLSDTGATMQSGSSANARSGVSLHGDSLSTVTVAGTVVFSGKPVSDAAVFLCIPENLTPEQLEVKRVATTGADGTFSFMYTTFGNAYRQSSPVVFAWKEGFAFGMKRLTEESSKVTLQIVCNKPEPVTGYVYDENGNGIVGAVVIPLFTVGTKGIYYDDYVYCMIPGLETTSGPDGSFELKYLPPGITVRLALHASGYARKVIGPIRAGQRGFPFTLVREGRIAGRVIDSVSGKPAANVTVRALHESNIYFCDPLSAMTGADGRFLVTGVAPGMYTIFIAQIPEAFPGRMAWFVKNVEVRMGNTTDAPEIRLVAGALLTGRLSFRETGEPVSGVLVEARVKGEHPRNVYTDDTGVYTVLCAPGAGIVRPSPMNVYNDVGMEPRSREFEAADGDTIDGLDFTFEKGIPIIVRILTPEGEPVPYARLSGFSVVGESGEVTIWCSKKREQFGLRATCDNLQLRGENRTTDLRPGTVLEIRMQRYETESASGRVIESTGKSIPLASISARSKRKDIKNATWNSDVGGLTDGDGEFTVDGLVIGDENAVIVAKEGYKNAEVTLDSLITRLNDLGDIVLEPAPCRLKGFVLNKHGKPIPGARVGVYNDYNDFVDNSANTITDSDGRYRLEGLLPVMKWMQVDKENYREYYTRDVVTNATRNIVLLGEDRYLDGTVTNADGHPIAGVEFFYDIRGKKAVTDTEGKYRLDGLCGVTANIQIIHPDYGECMYYFIPTNGSWNVVLKKPDRFLGGTVVSPDGKPLAGVSIRNFPYHYPEGPEYEQGWNPFGETRWTTDEKGRFRIDGIIDGVFSVVLYNEEYGEVEIGDIETNRDDAVLVMKDDPDQSSRGKYRIFDSGDAAPVMGSPAPEFNASRWINGAPLTAAGLRGKTVILDFWSKDDPLSWNATRLMQALHTEYSDRDVAVIGVHEYTDDIEAVRAVLNKNGVTYPVFVDAPSSREKSGGATFDAYGVHTLDEDFLIDRNGTVRLHVNIHLMEQELLNLIADGI